MNEKLARGSAEFGRARITEIGVARGPYIYHTITFLEPITIESGQAFELVWSQEDGYMMEIVDEKTGLVVETINVSFEEK